MASEHRAHTPRTELPALESPVAPPADLSAPVLEELEVESESEAEVEQVESAVAVSAHTPEPPASYPQE